MLLEEEVADGATSPDQPLTKLTSNGNVSAGTDNSDSPGSSQLLKDHENRSTAYNTNAAQSNSDCCSEEDDADLS